MEVLCKGEYISDSSHGVHDEFQSIPAPVFVCSVGHAADDIVPDLCVQWKYVIIFHLFIRLSA